MARRFLVLGSTLAALLLASPAPPPLAQGASPALDPGSEAYLDPASGQFAAPPPEVRVRWSEARAAELSKHPRAALRERPGNSAAGGYEVELPERFTSRLVATLDAEGRLAMDCETGQTTSGGER